VAFARTPIVNILTTNTNIESVRYQNTKKYRNAVKSLANIIDSIIESAQVVYTIQTNNQIDRYIIQELVEKIRDIYATTNIVYISSLELE